MAGSALTDIARTKRRGFRTGLFMVRFTTLN